MTATASQKTYTAYKVSIDNATALNTAIAAHIAGLASGHEGAVERLDCYIDDGIQVGMLIMSDYVPLDTSIVSLGSAKLTGMNSGTAKGSFIAPFNGKIVTVYSRVSADPGAGTAVANVKVNGGTAATATIVHPNGAAANSLVTATIADNNVVVAGDKVEVTSTNAATNAVDCVVGVLMQKTA